MSTTKAKKRDIVYKGFEISLVYDPGDWVGVSSGWDYGLYDTKKNMDYGFASVRLSYREALEDAKYSADEIRKGRV